MYIRCKYTVLHQRPIWIHAEAKEHAAINVSDSLCSHSKETDVSKQTGGDRLEAQNHFWIDWNLKTEAERIPKW